MLQLNTQNQSEYIDKVKQYLFYLSASIIALAEILDPIFIKHQVLIVYLNTFIALLMVVTILLFKKKKIHLKWANSIVIYLVLFDLLISPLFRLESENLALFLMRMSIVIYAIIPYAGFAIHKRHIIIIGTLYLINYLLITYWSRDEFLINAMSVILLTHFAFVSGIYFLISSLGQALTIQKKLLDNSNRTNNKLKKQSKALKKAVKSKNDLISILSHDLKSPFNSIIGFASLGLSDIKKNRTSKFDIYFRAIENSANQTYLLLLNLLDWMGTEKDNLQLYPEIINVLNTVQDSAAFFHHEAEGKQIVLNIDIDKTIDVMGDKNMLESVIRNLLSNSIKYSHEKGVVKISAVQLNTQIFFTISNNGVAVSEDQASTLFKKKRNKSMPGTKNEKGSGIGLTICRDFMKFHKGKIWAKPNTPTGLIVNFTLPI